MVKAEPSDNCKCVSELGLDMDQLLLVLQEHKFLKAWAF
jgi:hypothetical protein